MAAGEGGDPAPVGQGEYAGLIEGDIGLGRGAVVHVHANGFSGHWRVVDDQIKPGEVVERDRLGGMDNLVRCTGKGRHDRRITLILTRCGRWIAGMLQAKHLVSARGVAGAQGEALFIGRQRQAALRTREPAA